MSCCLLSCGWSKFYYTINADAKGQLISNPVFVNHLATYIESESTKQMEQTLRAKVKIVFKSENLKKMLLIKISTNNKTTDNMTFQ